MEIALEGWFLQDEWRREMCDASYASHVTSKHIHQSGNGSSVSIQ